MKDHIWEHNNRYLIKAVEGQKDQFDLIPVPGTVYQVGTPITKATLLQDETVQRYKNTDSNKNIEETPDGVFRALSQAQAFSTLVLLTSSQTVGYGEEDSASFAKFSKIEYDATGYCTDEKIYIPKHIKKILVSVYFRAARTAVIGAPTATIYKNGSPFQSIDLTGLISDGKWHTHNVCFSLDTKGSGSEYIQLYLTGEKQTSFASAIQTEYFSVQMLSY